MRNTNFILIFFNLVQGHECLAQRLELDLVGSEKLLTDQEELKELFGTVFQKDGSDADLEQNLHLTTCKYFFSDMELLMKFKQI